MKIPVTLNQLPSIPFQSVFLLQISRPYRVKQTHAHSECYEKQQKWALI